MTLGNGFTETWQYSPTRWQPRQITVANTQTPTDVKLDLKLKYCDSQPTADCALNNGNIQWQEIAGPGLSFVQGYLYDRFNRLGSFSETASGAAEGYGFDKFGNRWRTSRIGMTSDGTGTPSSASWFSNNKNRAIPPAPAGGPATAEADYFDAAGNQIKIAAMGLTYDGEGRVSQVTNTGSGLRLTSMTL